MEGHHGGPHSAAESSGAEVPGRVREELHLCFRD